MKVHLIYAGYGLGEWTVRPPFDARNLLTAAPGLSGTEVQVFGQALELARRGHDVTVFSRFVEDHCADGVRYWQLDAPHERCDVAIAYHDGRPLDGWKAKLKVAYHQTYLVSNRQQDASYTGADFADLYLTASERVARHLRRAYGWKDVRVVPNAWDIGDLKPWRPTPGRLVFTTSVDRGAPRLLEALPAIRERVPEAHVVMLGRGSPGLLGIQSSDAVTLLDQVSRNEVLELLSTASCYAYPCDVPSPTECFPVSLLESCAAGVPLVLAPDDDIEDIFAPGAWITPSIKREPGAWKDAFVSAVSDVLSNSLTRQAYSRRAQEFAAPYRFAQTVDVLCREVGL